tara:strand:- start:269 stop:484 length:216 start_codon:yes stop_codon:yes gene_type:complete
MTAILIFDIFSSLLYLLIVSNFFQYSIFKIQNSIKNKIQGLEADSGSDMSSHGHCIRFWYIVVRGRWVKDM